MFRRLQLLILAAILVIAAFSTGLTFLFYLVYLGVLVVGGSYVLTRLGLADLEAGLRGQPAVRPRRRPAPRDVHAPQHEPPPQAVARDPQPDDAARRPARPGHRAPRPDRAVMAGPGAADAARPLPDRAAADPDRRPVRVLRGVGVGRPGRHRRRLSARRAAAAVAAAGGEHRGQPRDRRERTLQTTPLATTVRPYAPGDAFNRIHWRSTARHGEIQVKEFDLEQTADAWIFLDLDAVRAARARATSPRSRSAVRAAAADRGQGAASRTAPSGMTVNGHRLAHAPAGPRRPPAPEDHAAARGGRRRRHDAARRGADRRAGRAPARHDRDRDHAVPRSRLGPAAGHAPHPRHRVRRGLARRARVRAARPSSRGRAGGSDRRRAADAPSVAARSSGARSATPSPSTTSAVYVVGPRHRSRRPSPHDRRRRLRTPPASVARRADPRDAVPPGEGWLSLFAAVAMLARRRVVARRRRLDVGRRRLADFLPGWRCVGLAFGVVGAKVGWGRWRTHLDRRAVRRADRPAHRRRHRPARRTGRRWVRALRARPRDGRVARHVWIDLAVVGLPVHAPRSATTTSSSGLLVLGRPACSPASRVFGHRRPLDAVVVARPGAPREHGPRPRTTSSRSSSLFSAAAAAPADPDPRLRGGGRPGSGAGSATRPRSARSTSRGGTRLRRSRPSLGSILLTATRVVGAAPGALGGPAARHLVDDHAVAPAVRPAGRRHARPRGRRPSATSAMTSGQWQPSDDTALPSPARRAAETELFKWRAGTYDEYTGFGWNWGHDDAPSRRRPATSCSAATTPATSPTTTGRTRGRPSGSPRTRCRDTVMLSPNTICSGSTDPPTPWSSAATAGSRRSSRAKSPAPTT